MKRIVFIDTTSPDARDKPQQYVAAYSSSQFAVEPKPVHPSLKEEEDA